MAEQNRIRQGAEFVHSFLMIAAIVLWVIFAVFSVMRAAFRKPGHDCPYWAEDGNSENIRALKF